MRSRSAAVNAAACSRRILRAAVGMPWRARNATKSADAVGVRREWSSRWRRQGGRSALSSAALAACGAVWPRC